jgi:maleate cis-trans isomerase
MYGWRARIGLLIPSTNTTMEVDFYRMAPEGVSVHTARLKTEREGTIETLLKMEETAEEAAESLATAKVDVIVFGCTSGSFIKGPEWNKKIIERLESITKIPVVTTAQAMIEALKEMGIQKISLTTPYVEVTNKSLISFLESYDFKVLDLKTFDMLDMFDHAKIEPSEIYCLAKKSDKPEADGIFIACTQLRAIDIIETLEKDIKKPVVTAIQASMWLALKVLKVSMEREGFGKLMRRL